MEEFSRFSRIKNCRL